MKKFFAVVVAAFAVTLSGYAGRIDDLRTAAERGDAKAQLCLGNLYSLGSDFFSGVPKDRAEAVKWYRKAAEQGLAEAQLYLAGCYSRGDGVRKDLTTAVKWYRKAAAQGDVIAQYYLRENGETW